MGAHVAAIWARRDGFAFHARMTFAANAMQRSTRTIRWNMATTSLCCICKLTGVLAALYRFMLNVLVRDMIPVLSISSRHMGIALGFAQGDIFDRLISSQRDGLSIGCGIYSR